MDVFCLVGVIGGGVSFFIFLFYRMEEPAQHKKLLLLNLLRKRRRLGYLSDGLVRTKRLALCYAILHLYKKKNHVRNQVRRQRRWWVRPVFADHDTHGAWVSLIPTMRDTDRDLYYNFMRMTPECFDRLLALIMPFIRKYSWRKPIPPGERLAITLRYLASGDSQTSLSFLFRVSNQAISKIVLETTSVIWSVLKKTVFPKLDRDLWLKTAAEFEVMWNIPHCLGAVDGKQVYIKAFPHSGSRWFGYKKRHCMTFMGVSNAKHQFIIVESGASGKRSDANIFHRSNFASKLIHGQLNIPPSCPVSGLTENLPFFFVGDNAYPKSGNFAVPFKGMSLKDEEMVYNYRLSRARRVVENAFGILCARFRIMFRPIEGSPSLVRSIILCCLALHNMHLQDEESVPPAARKYKPFKYADFYREDRSVVYGRWRNEDPNAEKSLFHQLVKQSSSLPKQQSAKGLDLQEMLVRYFVIKSVPWQWEKANLLL
ncbi:Protein ALP1-like [Frankliniella fusca]|uniref:Protein ALP1-like n=1 Tax=Frankliniella fusca TaxID=407009 RepID=A0AAE1I2I1_9NEOP|nr:Protein ALP1-like [Frankliniella fusca]